MGSGPSIRLYSLDCLERLSEKGAQRCRVTNRRQPAGQEQAISSHFVGSRGTVLVSIETFQTVSEEAFSETKGFQRWLFSETQ